MNFISIFDTMKYLIYLVPFTVLFSCAGTPQEEEKTKDKETLIETPVNDTDSLLVEDLDVAENEIALEDFPHEWIMLTDAEGGGENKVIYKSCAAETQNFSFTPQKGESWQIYLAYGQDGEVCDVAAFDAVAVETDGVQMVDGTFEFKGAYDESMRFVRFSWNKDEKIGHFDGMGMSSEWFVPASDAHHYETVKEDCEGLWE